MIKKILLQVGAALFGFVAIMGLALQVDAAQGNHGHTMTEVELVTAAVMHSRASAARCLMYESKGDNRPEAVTIFLGRVGAYTPDVGYQIGFADGAVQATAFLMLGVPMKTAIKRAAILLYKREHCTFSEST